MKSKTATILGLAAIALVIGMTGCEYYTQPILSDPPIIADDTDGVAGSDDVADGGLDQGDDAADGGLDQGAEAVLALENGESCTSGDQCKSGICEKSSSGAKKCFAPHGGAVSVSASALKPSSVAWQGSDAGNGEGEQDESGQDDEEDVPLKIEAFYPVPSAKDVSLDTKIKIFVNKKISFNKDKITISPQADIGLVSIAKDNVGFFVDVELAEALKPSTQYTITLKPGAVTDLQGKSAPSEGQKSWNFTTKAADPEKAKEGALCLKTEDCEEDLICAPPDSTGIGFVTNQCKKKKKFSLGQLTTPIIDVPGAVMDDPYDTKPEKVGGWLSTSQNNFDWNCEGDGFHHAVMGVAVHAGAEVDYIGFACHNMNKLYEVGQMEEDLTSIFNPEGKKVATNHSYVATPPKGYDAFPKEFLVGFETYSWSYTDKSTEVIQGIRPMTVTLLSPFAFSGPWDVSTPTGWWGQKEGWKNSIQCPAWSVMTGIYGYEGDRLDNIGIECRELIWE